MARRIPNALARAIRDDDGRPEVHAKEKPILYTVSEEAHTVNIHHVRHGARNLPRIVR